MFRKLEAAWQALRAPIAVLTQPKSPTKPPQWNERLRQTFSAVLATLPKPKEIALPQPQPLPAWRVEVQLRQVWEEFTQPIRLPEITLTQPPGEEAWTSQLDQLWTCYQQVPLPDPLAIVLPPPIGWRFPCFDRLDQGWSEFQLALLNLPVAPSSWRALCRRELKRQESQPEPEWVRVVEDALDSALEALEPPVFPAYQLPQLVWGTWLTTALERALAPIPAPLPEAKFREPEPRFADLPAWEQRLWQAWWQYEQPTSAPALTQFQHPQPVRMGWEAKLAGFYRDISGLPRIAVSQLALPTVSTSASQPLGFEEKLRLALNSPRLKEAKRRQSHPAPTHKWKQSRPQAKTGPGWMHAGRWTVQFDRRERIITATSWTGQRTRKMVVEKTPLYRWKAQRIRPPAREGLELAQEVFETRAGLEITSGLHKPRWLSEQEWLWRRAQPEHAEMESFLASEELATRAETAGNPDLRRKFAAL